MFREARLKKLRKKLKNKLMRTVTKTFTFRTALDDHELEAEYKEFLRSVDERRVMPEMRD